jgi:hypothetical protein
MTRTLADINNDIAHTEAAIYNMQCRLRHLIQERETENSRLRAARARPKKTYNEKVAFQEEKRRRFVAQLEVDGFARFVGVRNTRYPWRKIVSFNDGSVTGWTYMRDKKTGRFIQGGAGVTTNGTDKIAEVVSAKDAIV